MHSRSSLPPFEIPNDRWLLQQPQVTIDGSFKYSTWSLFGSKIRRWLVISILVKLIFYPNFLKICQGIWEARDTGMPNSRRVRAVLAPDLDHFQKETTMLLMQFGQFVDHDITHVPVFQFRKIISRVIDIDKFSLLYRIILANGSGISCCTPDGKHQPKELRHPHCFTLDILPDDAFYRSFKVECVNFVRSMVAPRSDCTFGYAEQLSQVILIASLLWVSCLFILDNLQVTHWHDASAIYGSTQFQSDILRERKGGRMKIFSYQNRQLLPLDWNNKDCIGFNKGLRCFLSGGGF